MIERFSQRSGQPRRQFLQNMAFGAAMFSTPGLFAEQLMRTPSSAEGPFYPDKLPLDTDNDLLVINDTITPAVGTVAYVSGRVLDPSGSPIRNAIVEIWQADNAGCYIHSRSDNKDKSDGNFQGFGRFLTGSKGEYVFRTIKPVPYTGRTPHIHFAVNHGGKRVLTTQLYVKGEAQNEKDFLYRQVGDASKQKLVTSEFAKVDGGKAGEVAAKFDLVVGLTPEDA